MTGTVYAPFSLPSSSLAVSGETLTISLPQTLADDTFYQVTIPAGAIDDTSGNPLAADYDFGFTTEFVAVSTNPPNGATGVSIDSPITVTFSNVVAAGPSFSQISLYPTGAPGSPVALNPVQLTPVSSGNQTQMTITLPDQVFLALGTGYQLDVPAGAVQDLAGNPLTAAAAAACDIQFQTEQSVTLPQVL